MKRTITVFGSSVPARGEEQYETACRLGSLLALNGFNVCSGGYRGIMDAVSKGAVENGGEAVGITLKESRSNISSYLTAVEQCNSLFERLIKLIETGSGYIVLRGGTGTLLELAAIWEMMNKGIIGAKPAACYSSMWEKIVAVMDDQILTEGREKGLIKVFSDIDEIVKYFVDYFSI